MFLYAYQKVLSFVCFYFVGAVMMTKDDLFPSVVRLLLISSPFSVQCSPQPTHKKQGPSLFSLRRTHSSSSRQGSKKGQARPAYRTPTNRPFPSDYRVAEQGREKGGCGALCVFSHRSAKVKLFLFILASTAPPPNTTTYCTTIVLKQGAREE